MTNPQCTLLGRPKERRVRMDRDREDALAAGYRTFTYGMSNATRVCCRERRLPSLLLRVLEIERSFQASFVPHVTYGLVYRLSCRNSGILYPRRR